MLSFSFWITFPKIYIFYVRLPSRHFLKVWKHIWASRSYVHKFRSFGIISSHFSTGFHNNFIVFLEHLHFVFFSFYQTLDIITRVNYPTLFVFVFCQTWLYLLLPPTERQYSKKTGAYLFQNRQISSSKHQLIVYIDDTLNTVF